MLDDEDRYAVDGPGLIGTLTLAAVAHLDGDIVAVL